MHERPACIDGAKIHLVDGTFELVWCFNGAPRATNCAGEEVGASRAFAHTPVTLLRRDDVTHVAVTFDGGGSRKSEGALVPGMS